MKAKETVETARASLRLPLSPKKEPGQRTDQTHGDLELVRSAVAQLDAGFAVLDRRGRVLAASRDAALLLGVRQKKSSTDLVLPRGEIRRAVLEAVKETVATAQPVLFSLPVAAEKDSDTGLAVRMFPASSAKGGVLGVLLTLEQPGTRRSDGEDPEFSKLFAEVASHVAHEIRNPLGTIGGFASLLEREFSADDRRKHWVRKIIDAVARLDRMVTQLHLYVQPVKAQVRPADLVEKTREAFEFAELKFGASENGVVFDYVFPDEPVYVSMDPHWWQEVVLTISANAIQAMKRGGRVSVRVDANGDGAAVVVQDEGEGITGDMGGKIFYPFFSSKPDGTGLGLNVARKLLRAMGATIEVTSQPEQGTNVRMVFQKV